MKIAYLIPEFPGQTHIWMWREMQHLRDWGWEIQVISTRPPRKFYEARHTWAGSAKAHTIYLTDRLTHSIGPLLLCVLWALATRPIRLLSCARLAWSLPIDARPAWRYLLPLLPAACRLARESTRLRIQHVHCHTCANGAVLAMMNRRLTYIPFSMTLNANIEWWGGAMREKFKDASFTVVITNWLLEQVRRDYPELPRSKMILGRVGVDTRRWQAQRVFSREPGAEFRLVSVGRLKEKKGHGEVIQAVARLSKMDCRISLRILGDGPDRMRLQAMIESLNLHEQVCLLGSVAEERVIEELAAADAFVLVSHTEPLGVAYMEAMALGLPTIGTTDGGAGEIIDDGVSGLLVTPQDTDAIASAIVRLMGDSQLRARMSLAGRHRIVHQFDSRLGAAVLFERISGELAPLAASSDSIIAECTPACGLGPT